MRALYGKKADKYEAEKEYEKLGSDTLISRVFFVELEYSNGYNINI